MTRITKYKIHESKYHTNNNPNQNSELGTRTFKIGEILKGDYGPPKPITQLKNNENNLNLIFLSLYKKN